MAGITPAKCRRIMERMPITKGLLQGFAAAGWQTELPAAYERCAQLYRENAGASKALQLHLKQLLPMIALYEAALRCTGCREAAMQFAEEWAFGCVEKMVKPARLLMKTGLYRVMPGLCRMLLDRMFGREAGFDYRLVPEERPFAVDMIRCPYLDTCIRYGCPELTRISCRADDITYGSLHPKLVWARTQTLGQGGSCCDFRLYVKEEKE